MLIFHRRNKNECSTMLEITMTIRQRQQSLQQREVTRCTTCHYNCRLRVTSRILKYSVLLLSLFGLSVSLLLQYPLCSSVAAAFCNQQQQQKRTIYSRRTRRILTQEQQQCIQKRFPPIASSTSSVVLQGQLANVDLNPIVDSSSDVVAATTMMMNKKSQITSIPIYEPKLDIPSLFVFSIIMGMFFVLQYRIRLIDEAYNARNLALQQLRTAKAMELSNSNSTSVTIALQQYNITYNRIEELRTVVILPGIFTARIIVPPSINNNDNVQMQHELAAQQYLGINRTVTTTTSDSSSSSSNNGINSVTTTTSTDTTTKPSQSMTRTIVLGIVAMTQILLFIFLIATDPMISSNTSL